MKDPRCAVCGEVPPVDPKTDEYDMYLNNHAPGRTPQWWCGECIGAKDGKPPPCPDEFMENGRCMLCD